MGSHSLQISMLVSTSTPEGLHFFEEERCKDSSRNYAVTECAEYVSRQWHIQRLRYLMLLLVRSLSFPLTSISDKRFYKRIMNLYNPRDERDYIAIADHGLWVFANPIAGIDLTDCFLIMVAGSETWEQPLSSVSMDLVSIQTRK